MEEIFFTPPEAAGKLGISIDHLRKLAMSGKIPSRKFAGKQSPRMFRAADLEAFLHERVNRNVNKK